MQSSYSAVTGRCAVCFDVTVVTAAASGTVMTMSCLTVCVAADEGWNDIVVRRSTTGGATWSAATVVLRRPDPKELKTSIIVPLLLIRSLILTLL